MPSFAIFRTGLSTSTELAAAADGAVMEGNSPSVNSRCELPITAYDLNEVDASINEECEVTALIDWELSALLSFGAGFGRIRTIAGKFTGGEFWMLDEFEIAERDFWRELLKGMLEHSIDTGEAH
ncbi:hypothetical protein F5Y12DRAFT_721119 [Xylaria sp. FL1777]|nr:hypothetical protein F5Y12DRAFT_721119 [Xylaria sp. FL1777]